MSITACSLGFGIVGFVAAAQPTTTHYRPPRPLILDTSVKEFAPDATLSDTSFQGTTS